ncbi:TerB family tellurite resistance protein [Desmonostoc muscorum CCALA 125]|nr:TerB family tellurite resistance protein [Desmonostoc muscorum CCALA 125]
MGFWGKMIFCTAGAVLGGPIGAAIGVTIGTAVDSFNSSNEELSNAQKIQLLFFRCLAKVAKSDGRVSDEEIAVVETIMKEGLELDEASRKVAISIFREAKDSNTSFEEYLTQLASLIEYDLEFGKFLLYAFYQVATADGSISSQEKQMLLQTERTLRLIPGTVEELLNDPPSNFKKIQLLFFGCLAKVAKSDGRVSGEEIAVVETIMKESLELDEASRKVAISIFREAKDSNTSFEEYLTQLASLIEYDLEFGKFLLYAFYQVATADGSISSQEKQMLLQTERTLRLIPGTVEELLENSMEPETAYQLLGCSPEMTDEEIKRIYRQKSLQFHPDQIRNKGLSSEFIEFANSQQAKINAAYEKIMSSRTSKAL